MREIDRCLSKMTKKGHQNRLELLLPLAICSRPISSVDVHDGDSDQYAKIASPGENKAYQ